MPLSDTEFAAIMSDRKWIEADIVWQEDEDHSPAREFRVEVSSNGGWPSLSRDGTTEGQVSWFIRSSCVQTGASVGYVWAMTTTIPSAIK